MTGTWPGRKTAPLERRPPLTIAVEGAGDANALGMVAAEPGMNAVDLFEAIDHPRLGQAARGEPAGYKGKASSDTQDRGADRRKPDRHAFTGQG